MTPYEFFKLTSEVRRLQKEYFKTRDKGILAESKVKERILDAEIARVEAMPEEEINRIMQKRKQEDKIMNVFINK